MSTVSAKKRQYFAIKLREEIRSYELQMKELSLNSKLIEKTDYLKDLIQANRQKLAGIDSGECDIEIEQTSVNQPQSQPAHVQAPPPSETKRESKSDKIAALRFDKDFSRFADVCATVPEYMSRSLESMPGNKAYRWRGVLLFGRLPAEVGGPVLIFDKKPEGMYITEITSTSHNEYLKTRDGNKQTISAMRRKINLRKPATLYIK